jgi:hypothetical protein
MSTDQDKGFKVVDRRGAADAPAAPEEPAPPKREERREPAEIDFGMFVMSLGSSALIHLGELPLPHDESGAPAPRVDLPLAKQTIDILGMLADKTRGNLSSDEEKLLEHLLYDLRLKFVEAKKKHG